MDSASCPTLLNSRVYLQLFHKHPGTSILSFPPPISWSIIDSVSPHPPSPAPKHVNQCLVKFPFNDIPQASTHVSIITVTLSSLIAGRCSGPSRGRQIWRGFKPSTLQRRTRQVQVGGRRFLRRSNYACSSSSDRHTAVHLNSLQSDARKIEGETIDLELFFVYTYIYIYISQPRFWQVLPHKTRVSRATRRSSAFSFSRTSCMHVAEDLVLERSLQVL